MHFSLGQFVSLYSELTSFLLSNSAVQMLRQTQNFWHVTYVQVGGMFRRIKRVFRIKELIDVLRCKKTHRPTLKPYNLIENFKFIENINFSCNFFVLSFWLTFESSFYLSSFNCTNILYYKNHLQPFFCLVSCSSL